MVLDKLPVPGRPTYSKGLQSLTSSLFLKFKSGLPEVPVVIRGDQKS